MTLKEQWKLWVTVALQSFGGPAAQIAVIHKEVVETRKLLSEERFLHALNFCMLLPGPEAQQLATYVGWLLDKWRGGLLAGLLFILPGFLSILTLSYLYVFAFDYMFVKGLFYGIKPAVIAIVFAALFRIAKKTLRTHFAWFLSACAFLSLFLFQLPFPLVVIASAILGFFWKHSSEENLSTVDGVFHETKNNTFTTILIWLFIWSLPAFLVLILFGSQSTFHQLNFFFSKMSMVTFGGAYAALAYVAQQAVDVYQWLQGKEMLDGLAMAETTPGPLIQSVQFVGFLAAYRYPDFSNPLLSAFFGSVLVTWMTFTPCFLWVFTFAPYVESIRGMKRWNRALAAITASVVGVILNLSIWFVFKTIFTSTSSFQNYGFHFEYPKISSIDSFATGICLVALLIQFVWKQSIGFLLGVSIGLGIFAQWMQWTG